MSNPHLTTTGTTAAANRPQSADRSQPYAAHDSAPIGRRPLRIALVAPPYYSVPPEGYGGIESVVACMADALVEDGHEVLLLGAGQGGGTLARFVPVWPHTVAERLGEVFPELAYTARVREVLSRLIYRGAIDIVHDHTNAGPLNAAVHAASGVPTVTTMHGPATSTDLCEIYRALGDSISLVAISNRQRELAPDLNWLATVPNGIRVDEWPMQHRKQDYALFLGRFSADKGAHTAIEAAHAAGLPLILAGKCSEPQERRYFAERIAPILGPDDVIYGVAATDEKRVLLAHARCLLFPIQWEEPFGVVMIEAMACGTPVVALRAGAVPEVVADGVTGIICDTTEQLPRALEAVRALDPAACRRHVTDNFEASLVGPRHAAAYRLAIARAARGRFAASARLEEHRATRLPMAPGTVRRHDNDSRRDRLAVQRPA